MAVVEGAEAPKDPIGRYIIDLRQNKYFSASLFKSYPSRHSGRAGEQDAPPPALQDAGLDTQAHNVTRFTSNGALLHLVLGLMLGQFPPEIKIDLGKFGGITFTPGHFSEHISKHWPTKLAIPHSGITHANELIHIVSVGMMAQRGWLIKI
jgi:hypothetical protein